MVSGARIMKFLGSDSEQMLHWTNFRQVFRNKHNEENLEILRVPSDATVFFSLPGSSKPGYVNILSSANIADLEYVFSFLTPFSNFFSKECFCAPSYNKKSCSSHNILSSEITVNLYHVSHFWDNRTKIHFFVKS